MPPRAKPVIAIAKYMPTQAWAWHPAFGSECSSRREEEFLSHPGRSHIMIIEVNIIRLIVYSFTRLTGMHSIPYRPVNIFGIDNLVKVGYGTRR